MNVPGRTSSVNHAAPRRARLWFPDLALFLSFLTLICCLTIFDGWHQLFRDSDTGWHIRTGERILAARSLPASDPYSFTRAGAPWLDWEWGADLLSALAHRAAGPAGVAVLFSCAIALCTWLWVRWTFAVNGDFLLACLFAAPMLSTANLHWLARPHIFGWALLLVCLLMLERRAARPGFFLLGALWANLHGSFFLGPAMAVLYAAGEWAAGRIWSTSPESNLFRRWAAAAAMLAGTLVNPYGWNLHRHVLAYLSDSELLARIGEFQSFNFHSPGAAQILVALALAAAGAVIALTERRAAHFLVSALFIAIALRSARGLPIVALAALPIANGAFTEALRRARGLAPALRLRVDAALDYSARLRLLDAGLGGWAWLPVVLAFTLLAARTAQAGFPADQFPVEAAPAVAALPADARILAPDKFGGYLVYRFDGRRKVYFDGRSDFYGLQFMRDYISLVEVRPGWREQVRRFGFTHALLPNNYSLVAALEDSGWRRIHRDQTATLLAAPGH